MGLSLKGPEQKRTASFSSAMFDIKSYGKKCRNKKTASMVSQTVVPVETTDEETKALFVEAFIANNRLDYITQLMGYHRKYLECFLKTQNHLMRADGPLPFTFRHYIAIMAAGRHKCSYLIHLQATEFLLQGGDPDWLKGLDYIPQKLRDLYEINKLLAHRPWLINKNHIEKLTKGSNKWSVSEKQKQTKGSNNWSVSEVTQALIILSHFHALSGFIFGCGISWEIDDDLGHTYHQSYDDPYENGCHSEDDEQSIDCTEGGIEALLERMKRLTETREETTHEEMLKGFEKVESPSLDLSSSNEVLNAKADILRYVDEPDFTYQDFAKRINCHDIATFRAQDYSWEDHGFSLANRLYPDIGSLLDEKFRVAYNMTYNTLGDTKGVDTTAFRRAIWNYIHCMYGIRHDDYNYAEVNQLLERNLKAYVKTVTCYPEQVSHKDYDSVMREFKHSEKVHVNLMMLEARLQAELLYSLRAVMRYMT